MAITINGTGSISGLTATGISAQPVFPGNVLQVVNHQTGTMATGITTIPVDNTIPQNTEGDQYMSLAITPTSASSKLVISTVAIVANSVNSNFAVALFQDSTANALATAWQYIGSTHATVAFTHYMTAGTTSSTTFKVRAGGHTAGTTTFNGIAATAYYGGTFASSITIWEIAA